jgi:hypothetical protein
VPSSAGKDSWARAQEPKRTSIKLNTFISNQEDKGMLTAFAYALSPSAPFGDVFFSVSVSFFQRGISAMMTFLGLGFGVSIFVLSSALAHFM